MFWPEGRSKKDECLSNAGVSPLTESFTCLAGLSSAVVMQAVSLRISRETAIEDDLNKLADPNAKVKFGLQLAGKTWIAVLMVITEKCREVNIRCLCADCSILQTPEFKN